MPRRVYTYPSLPHFTLLNLVSTAGAFTMGIAMLVFFYNVYKSLKQGEPASNDPWDGFTLEWYSWALPGMKNFESVPEIKGRRPFWDEKYPENADWKNDD
jgi:heme/copper-type cytochrome/quinol oxidase subunit 1